MVGKKNDTAESQSLQRENGKLQKRTSEEPVVIVVKREN